VIVGSIRLVVNLGDGGLQFSNCVIEVGANCFESSYNLVECNDNTNFPTINIRLTVLIVMKTKIKK
jgi:hypothetical protein